MCKETSRTQTAVVRYRVCLIDERIHGWKPHNTINTRLASSFNIFSPLCACHAVVTDEDDDENEDEDENEDGG